MLPVSAPKGLKPAAALSAAVAILMAGASLAGLLYPQGLYPTEALRQSFVANDVVNLLIGLPILVVAIMGLVCFIPFGLYARGVWTKGKEDQEDLTRS
jgi:hypothetical protein